MDAQLVAGDICGQLNFGRRAARTVGIDDGVEAAAGIAT